MHSTLKIERKVMSRKANSLLRISSYVGIFLGLLAVWGILNAENVGYMRGYEEGYQKALRDDSVMLNKFLENLETCQELNGAQCSMRFLPMRKEKDEGQSI